MDTRESITAALKKLGPSGPSAIADHIGVELPKTKQALRAMKKDGSLKTAGATVSLVYALPDQEIKDTPPRSGKKKGKKKSAKKARKARQAAAPTPRSAALPAETSITAAITEDYRLVIVGRGPVPEIYTPAQTERIAALILQQFNPT